MKINDIKALIADYGENTTLKDVLKNVQENRNYKCPKCSGSGKITIMGVIQNEHGRSN